jgi:hypothetical protein
MKVTRSRRRADLLELDDAERRLKPFNRVYLGVRAIPLEDIVGTDGKAGSFTGDFEPRLTASRHRLRSLEEAFPDGGFPPIVAVKLGETYFVMDGHHRVALARQAGAATIDADITEFISLVPLPSGADLLELVLRQLEIVFLDESGLAEARPGARIPASRPAVYLELLENLQVHGYHLMRDDDRIVSDSEIAGDWYDNVYAPAVGAIDRSRLGKAFRAAPEGDLFLWLHSRRRDSFPSCGCPPLAETFTTATTPASARGRKKTHR